MIHAITPVAALLFGTAILLTGQGLQGTLIPVRATLEDFSTISIGLMGAAYFLGFTYGCWKGAVLIRRAGHVSVFAAMTAIASATPLLHGLWVNAWVWSSLRAFSGFCFAVLYLVIESWLNERSTNDSRGTVFSAYILINMTFILSNPYWPGVLCGAAAIACFYLLALQEDKRLHAAFGADYKAYQERVPGVNPMMHLLRLFG